MFENRPRNWINITEFQEYEDYECHLTVGQDNGLYVVSALYNGWDSITGWRYTSAPPAQQYGFRLREFLAERKAEQAAREQMAEEYALVGEEPF